MSKGDIRLSPKYGLNPAIPICYFCGENKNEIIIPGKLKGDIEAPKACVWNMNPCDKCEGYMKKGILCMSVDPEKSKQDTRNPYRTGGWVVVKEEVIPRFITDEKLVTQIMKARFVFIEDEVWDKIGLPRGEIKNETPS